MLRSRIIQAALLGASGRSSAVHGVERQQCEEERRAEEEEGGEEEGAAWRWCSEERLRRSPAPPPARAHGRRERRRRRARPRGAAATSHEGRRARPPAPRRSRRFLVHSPGRVGGSPLRNNSAPRGCKLLRRSPAAGRSGAHKNNNAKTTKIINQSRCSFFRIQEVQQSLRAAGCGSPLPPRALVLSVLAGSSAVSPRRLPLGPVRAPGLCLFGGGRAGWQAPPQLL